MTATHELTFTGAGCVQEPTAEVAARPAIIDHPGHEHGLATIEGYVVRHTLGAPFTSSTARPGRDVAVVTHSGQYAVALELALGYRTRTDYAVVDMLYVCGCRS